METLLRLLQQDATVSREDLARQLNLPVAEVNARITALEKDGVIRGYQAIVDRERLDQNTVTAFIEVKARNTIADAVQSVSPWQARRISAAAEGSR